MNENNIIGLTALIAVEKALYSFDRLYTYSVPYELESQVQAGKRVLVPFGRGSRKIVGMIFSVKTNEYDPLTVKPISEVVDEEAYMTREMLELAHWLKENTFCTYFHAVRCILPPVLRSSTAFPKEKTQKIIKLNVNAELPDSITPKQKSVIEILENSSASVKELCYLCGVGAGVITNLIKKNILIADENSIVVNDDLGVPARDINDIQLTEKQGGVFDSLLILMQSGEAKAALLHGVTGSGKTSVFIKLVGEALKQGKSALILVPEISLTPQTIAIFKGYFGDNAAVIHSGLSMSKRTSEYRRIRDGDAKIVVGTRSAVFAPLENIGIIVIDEEGEHTYKSERSPRYHARDAAKQRCFKHKALLLLCSATPSMDSYRKAQIGKYSLFELHERYSGNKLPDVHIMDMKLEQAYGNTSNFSEMLLKNLKSNLDKGEQSLILLNRRGYHTFISCIVCGEVAMCPHCGVSLTQHQCRGKSGEAGTRAQVLCCHYCGFLNNFAGKCGKCSSAFVRQTGTGTQRIEDELQELFPTARILRMDADTTMTKGSYERNFAAFGNHEYDIMVGTQMIAKGLDFPNVTLVGILLIDNSLYAGDYIGYERTFSLITQVVGRGGRAEKPGIAFLQTFTPEHYVLRLAAQQDYRGFYHEEASIREQLLYPPFCDLCVAEINAVAEKNAAGAAFAFLEIFDSALKNVGRDDPGAPLIPVRVLGPVKSGVGSINGRFRYRLIIKCRNSKAFREIMSKSLINTHYDKRFDNCNVNVWFE
jgi:primosomal protein N' (replication factor Y)